MENTWLFLIALIRWTSGDLVEFTKVQTVTTIKFLFAKKKNMVIPLSFLACSVFGEQGWPSGESIRLSLVWPGFKSRCRRHMWVEFVVSSLPCCEGFFSGYSDFPLSSTTNTCSPTEHLGFHKKTLKRVRAFQSKVLVFKERGKPEYPEKNLSEQRREPTTHSTHIWRRSQAELATLAPCFVRQICIL